MNDWQLIETAPKNQRILVTQSGLPPNDEAALAWLDVIDNRFYYAPQGGLLNWTPSHWMPLPDPPPTQIRDA